MTWEFPCQVYVSANHTAELQEDVFLDRLIAVQGVSIHVGEETKITMSLFPTCVGSRHR